MGRAEHKVWRFLDAGALDGATNMAVDEVLARISPRPVVRVYGWRPHAISLGHNQDAAEVDLGRCQQDGIDVVRRPTGGRAILHAHEVTYSVIIPQGTPWYEQTNHELYNQISGALVCGLRRLARDVSLEPAARADSDFVRYKQQFACFATSARYEIQTLGKKLVGSAQRRYQSSVLQHGSILLGREHLKLLGYLTSGNGTSADARKQLETHTVCLETLLHRRVAFEEVVNPLRRGFEEFFAVTLQPEVLSRSEWQAVEKIREQMRTHYKEDDT